MYEIRINLMNGFYNHRVICLTKFEYRIRVELIPNINAYVILGQKSGALMSRLKLT